MRALLVLLLAAVPLAGCAEDSVNGHAPVRTFSLAQLSPIVDGVANLTLQAHTRGMRLDDVSFSLDGVTLRRGADCARPDDGAWTFCPPGNRTDETGYAGASVLVAPAKVGSQLLVVEPETRTALTRLTLHA